MCKFRLFFLQKSTLSYMHITERRKIPKCGPFNTLHPHPEMSSTWIEESARKWGRKREREKKLKKFYHIVKKTRQDRSKEIYNPFCDGATKKLLQLNQNRYEAEFQIMALDFFRALRCIQAYISKIKWTLISVCVFYNPHII